MARLLGGSASPIGWSVQYIQASLDLVLNAVWEVHRDVPLTVSPPRPYPEVLMQLVPFEAPWTRELVIPCNGWTAYLNNFVNGGDPTAIGPAVARELGVRCVVAEHTPHYGPGHEGTQFAVIGPQGEPPLMYERAVSAVATDGQWQWVNEGRPLSFEEVPRYTARRIRHRLDRPLLIRYLRELGIPTDDDNAYGSGVVVQQVVKWPRRTVSLAEASKELNL
jgi:hypothetical protein